MVKDYLGATSGPLRRRTALTTRHMMGGRSSCAPLAVMGHTGMTQSLPRGTSPWPDTSSVELITTSAPRARDSPPYTGQLRHLVALRKWFRCSSPRARRRQ